MTQHALQSGDEITAVLAFETFLDLLEVPASWVGAFFPALVKLSVESASNTQLELNTREQALQVQFCNKPQRASSATVDSHTVIGSKQQGVHACTTLHSTHCQDCRVLLLHKTGHDQLPCSSTKIVFQVNQSQHVLYSVINIGQAAACSRLLY